MNESWRWLTVLAAFVAVGVSLMQWWLARTRLRLDLYDRRYKVFDAIKAFMISVVTNAKVKQVDYATMMRETGPAEFLFKKDIQDYAEVVRKNALDLMLASVRTENPNYEGFKADTDKQFELNIWFADQLTKGGLEAEFKSYLDFRNVP